MVGVNRNPFWPKRKPMLSTCFPSNTSKHPRPRYANNAPEKRLLVTRPCITDWKNSLHRICIRISDLFLPVTIVKLGQPVTASGSLLIGSLRVFFAIEVKFIAVIWFRPIFTICLLCLSDHISKAQSTLP